MADPRDIVAVLTKRQKQAMEILFAAARPLRNKDFKKSHDRNRRTTGWSKALGPCTKLRSHDPLSLWALLSTQL